MNRHLVTGILSVTLFIAIFGSAIAGVIPGRWEKVDTLKDGSDIIVVMKSGEKFFADFRSSDPDSITVKPMGEKEKRVGKAEVKQIEREGVKEDGALDGAAIGAAGGVGLGVLLGSLAGDYKEAAMAGLAIAGAGIGFGIGYGVDSSMGKPILLYQALE